MNKHYSNVLKERVVKKYLEDAKMNGLVLQYELADKSRIRNWQDQFYSMAVFQTIEEPEKTEGDREMWIRPSWRKKNIYGIWKWRTTF